MTVTTISLTDKSSLELSKDVTLINGDCFDGLRRMTAAQLGIFRPAPMSRRTGPGSTTRAR